MVDVEEFIVDGAEDFNEFSCGECGSIFDNIEEARECCQNRPKEKPKEEVEEIPQIESIETIQARKEIQVDKDLENYWNNQ